MANYAKWIGGALGWAIGGPIGALLGYAFGSVLGDNAASAGYLEEENPQTRPGDFAAALLALSAAVIKSDGRVQAAELEYVKHFYSRQFGSLHADQYMLALENMLLRQFSTAEICSQIQRHMDYSSRLQLLHFLFGIAKSDNHVAPEEVKTIFTIATNLGIESRDFESIKAMFYKDSTSSYHILEVDPSATNDEIKKAYRMMAIKFHPDKVAHLGEEFQKAAHEKFQKINEAYDNLKKERKFN